jgi:hypothetical protein
MVKSLLPPVFSGNGSGGCPERESGALPRRGVRTLSQAILLSPFFVLQTVGTGWLIGILRR